MSPKEKAIELVNKFYKYANDGKNGIYYDSKIWTKNAKECALIAVNDILKVAFYATDEIYNHYLEVKQEIEKL